jgi:hypothetical protein
MSNELDRGPPLSQGTAVVSLVALVASKRGAGGRLYERTRRWRAGLVDACRHGRRADPPRRSDALLQPAASLMLLRAAAFDFRVHRNWHRRSRANTERHPI